MSGTSNAYSKEMSVAIEAANKAAHLLRETFHHPMPDSDSREHADVDEKAEEIIQEALRKHFPDDGYLGEELGRIPPGAGNKRLWVVDPNDGTGAFQRGFRGAAISIALLDHGTLVLGLVYAYNHPDDRGDMITWHKGGELRRNGQVVAPARPAKPHDDAVVLVSQSADRNPDANARLIRPMRYRAMPSIAYRLALVAVGEGDAGVSLYGPTTWDVAGGHALLLGAGLDLYADNGAAIRYSPDGQMSSQGESVFGGRPAIVKQLQGQPWREVFSRPTNTETPVAPVSLSWPSRARACRDASRLAAAQGCLLGQLAGDALGSAVEFMNAEEIAQRYPDGLRDLVGSPRWETIPGQPTDDSEMALLLARTLVSNKDTGEAYQYWLNSQPPDIGDTISSALSSGTPSATSQSNGALMRISPLGIHAAKWLPDLATIDRLAETETRRTHTHRVCIETSILYTRAIAFAIADPWLGPKQLFKMIESWARELGVDPAISKRIALAKSEPPKDYMTHQGWVLTAFHNALYWLWHAENPEQGIVGSVMSGGDTDTNAAICGALLGAVFGREEIPRRWVRTILTCRPMASDPNVEHPRPQCLWPVDAMILAEQLLT